MREDLADQVDGSSDVDVHDEVEVVQGEGGEVSGEDLRGGFRIE